MSRASVWAEAVARARRENKPTPWASMATINAAEVDENGNLVIHGTLMAMPGHALALAHWIIQTFGDHPCECAALRELAKP